MLDSVWESVSRCDEVQLGLSAQAGNTRTTILLHKTVAGVIVKSPGEGAAGMLKYVYKYAVTFPQPYGSNRSGRVVR